MNYRLDSSAAEAMSDYITRRLQQPHFANARSVRNALDRARLRQANRLFDSAGGHGTTVNADDLSTLTAADILASRVFENGSSTANAAAPT